MNNIKYPDFKIKMQLFLFVLLFFMNLNYTSGFTLDNDLVCPPDITIGACNDYHNTDLTGHPMMNNISFLSFSYEDELHLNQCREGYIIRTWTGYTGVAEYECEQIITMEYQSAFNGFISWPKDWEGSCADDIPFTKPIYDPGFCDLMAHNYSDDTLFIQGSVCMKILRNWKIIDWCKYEPNSGSDMGLWEHTQVLKVIESQGPELSACEDWELSAGNMNCTASFEFSKEAFDENCEQLSDISWKIELDINNNWSVDSTVYKEGNNVAFKVNNLPVGTHKINWVASDQCGNTTQCVESVFVEDGKPPVPYCYLSFPTVLMPLSNMLEVNAESYIKGAIDNCSEESDLIHSWSPDPADTVRLFDCNDIGYQFIPLYTFDETGNFDFCFVFTRVVNHGDCSPTLNMVNGNITDFNGKPVIDIFISLGNDSLNLHKVDTTNTSGSFSFPYIETIADPQMYFETAGINGAYYTTLDLVMLQRYLLGLFKPADLDAFLIASDANDDQQVNFLDLVRIREIILGFGQENKFNSGLRIFSRDQENPEEYVEIESLKNFTENVEVVVIRKGNLTRFL